MDQIGDCATAGAASPNGRCEGCGAWCGRCFRPPGIHRLCGGPGRAAYCGAQRCSGCRIPAPLVAWRARCLYEHVSAHWVSTVSGGGVLAVSRCGRGSVWHFQCSRCFPPQHGTHCKPCAVTCVGFSQRRPCWRVWEWAKVRARAPFVSIPSHGQRRDGHPHCCCAAVGDARRCWHAGRPVVRVVGRAAVRCRRQDVANVCGSGGGLCAGGGDGGANVPAPLPPPHLPRVRCKGAPALWGGQLVLKTWGCCRACAAWRQVRHGRASPTTLRSGATWLVRASPLLAHVPPDALSLPTLSLLWCAAPQTWLRRKARKRLP